MSYKRIPLNQGRLDCLCGFYSVINSYIALGLLPDDKSSQTLMKKLISYKKDIFPGVMYEGMVMGQVISLIQKASSILHADIEIVRPFLYKNKPQTTTQFLDKLSDHLISNKSVAILGLGTPWNHWTVSTNITSTGINLFDSIGLSKIKFNEISIGRSFKDYTKIYICARETIVIKTK